MTVKGLFLSLIAAKFSTTTCAPRWSSTSLHRFRCLFVLATPSDVTYIKDVRNIKCVWRHSYILDDRYINCAWRHNIRANISDIRYIKCVWRHTYILDDRYINCAWRHNVRAYISDIRYIKCVLGHTYILDDRYTNCVWRHSVRANTYVRTPRNINDINMYEHVPFVGGCRFMTCFIFVTGFVFWACNVRGVR